MEYHKDPIPNRSKDQDLEAENNYPPPRILARSSHNLSRRLIDPDALSVLHHLKHRGYFSYLVGGCVRDILLSRVPKDFDIGTNATPSQVRKAFKNCRLIGKRFRLAHIIFRNNKIIEVSTFRREPDTLPDTEDRRELAIHSNKYYGTPAEDAWRRDFTINALFYNIGDFSIIDYTGGIDDLKNKVIRVIGDPDKRFFEDPVRMMRGIEFAARLGFSLEPLTYEGILRCKKEIAHGSSERIKEEIMAMLQGGYGYKSFSLFIETGLFFHLFPEFQPWDEWQINCLLSLLKQIDDSVKAGKVPQDYLCLAAFLWPYITRVVEQEMVQSLNDLDLLMKESIHPFCCHFNIRIHCRHMIKEIYRSIWKMKRGIGNKGEARLLRKEFFPDVLTFFRWLGKCGLLDADLAVKWEARVAGLKVSLEKRPGKKNWRRRKRRKKRPDEA